MVVVLLSPITVKLAHSFEHHEHEFCEATNTPNLHECEYDCSFFKYKLQQYHLKSLNVEIDLQFQDNFKIPSLGYSIYYSPQALSFSLRGPPVLV